ncbi:DOCK1 protein, partial [Columbina picui]|nr:DOCK1 protein [Columbina picui]
REFLRAINHFAVTLTEMFLSNSSFELQVSGCCLCPMGTGRGPQPGIHPMISLQLWNNYFHLAVAFLTQDSLQLENFSQAKRSSILAKYGDMRGAIGASIRDMWFNLGELQRGRRRPSALPPNRVLGVGCSVWGMGACRREQGVRSVGCVSPWDVHICRSERSDPGPPVVPSLLSCCRGHPELAKPGESFVALVTGLLERLLDYRAVMNDENKTYSMSCTVNLL